MPTPTGSVKENSLIAIIERLLDCETKGDADTLLDNAGTIYKPLLKRIVDRFIFKRTRNQNNFAHQWFSEIGKQTGEEMMDVKDRAKLDIGCIILCRDDAEYLQFMKDTMKGLDREQRLARMKFIPCTSLMTTSQKREFMDTFERVHRAEGYSLSIPKEKAA